jgi:hypothetical protein
VQARAGNTDAEIGVMTAQLIAAWPKNSREEVRVCLDPYKDTDTVDLRTWWRDGNNELRPGRSGLTLALRHLPRIAEALTKALYEAERRGLLSEEART